MSELLTDEELYKRLRSITVSLDIIANQMVEDRNDAEMISSQLERIADAMEKANDEFALDVSDGFEQVAVQLEGIRETMEKLS